MIHCAIEKDANGPGDAQDQILIEAVRRDPSHLLTQFMLGYTAQRSTFRFVGHKPAGVLMIRARFVTACAAAVALRPKSATSWSGFGRKLQDEVFHDWAAARPTSAGALSRPTS